MQLNFKLCVFTVVMWLHVLTDNIQSTAVINKEVNRWWQCGVTSDHLVPPQRACGGLDGHRAGGVGGTGQHGDDSDR